jgi:Mlc titration factor MtfA (ptsG expression regulator)
MEEINYGWVFYLVSALVIVAMIFIAIIVAGHVISVGLNSAFGALEIFWIVVLGKPLMRHFVWQKRLLTNPEKQVLYRHFAMYRNLSDHERAVFEHRVSRFIKLKKFEGLDGFELTREHLLIISAIAIKLTFGLRRYSMPVITTIKVFSGPFKNLRTGNIHKGEFNPNTGHVAFSWRDLIAGLDDPSDNLHLGLHEFTHALMIELYRGTWADTWFKWNYNKIDALIKHPHNRKILMEHPYLRPYARANKMEFFAVAVEHFFETPYQFERELPILYKAFVKLLNTDPKLWTDSD